MSNYSATLDAARAALGAKTPPIITVTLVTNQPGAVEPRNDRANGPIASYASGTLTYSPPLPGGGQIPKFRPENLHSGKNGLEYVFDNRVHGDQRFNAAAADRLGFRISGGPDNPVMQLTLLSWGSGSFDVKLEPLGKVLVGVGPAIGNDSHVDTAIYTVAFSVSRKRQVN